PAILSEYSFILLDDNNDPPGFAVTGSGIAADPFRDLPADNYHLVATHTNTDCESGPLPIVVKDITKDPIVTINPLVPYFSCAGCNPTGQLEASASDPVSGDINNFTYEWFAGTDTSVPPLPAGSNPTKVIDLGSGQYTLRVTDT